MVASVSTLPFTLQVVPLVRYAFIRGWVRWSDTPTFFNVSLDKILEAMQAQGVTPQYPVSMFIHKWDDTLEASELSVALPTTAAVKVESGGTIELPAGNALVAQHVGAIGETGKYHQAMLSYARQNKLMVGIMIEEYKAMHDVETVDGETWIIYRLYDGGEVPRIIC